jgi:hypothetical protein
MFSATQTRVFWTLFLISLIYFLAFGFINIQGARDINMLSVFEPDEFAQYSHVMRMMNQPAYSLGQSVYRFVAYQHYYYGYPFYFISAMLALLSLKLTIGLGNTTLNMLFLRQMISVLPMLGALMLLVYVQTDFKKYTRSVLLFLFLMAVPSVIRNDTWWHPESLVFLFIVLTFYFLQKDNFSFERNYYYAAIACGFAISTKLIGLFFFLAIPIYIVVAWRQGRLSFKQALRVAVIFVALMGVVFIVSSPFLFYASERVAAFKIQLRQSEAMSNGFVLSYAKGPLSWAPLIVENYAQPLFLFIAFIALGLGIANREKRLLNLMIFFWAVPFALYLLFFVAIKPKHFFLPILLPVFSTLPYLYDWLCPPVWKFSKSIAPKLLGLLIVGVITIIQVTYNINYGIRLYTENMQKEKKSVEVQFFDELNANYLSRIPLDKRMVIFRDVRMYVANSSRWDVKHRWGLTDYSVIKKINPDMVILWKQRIYDYTNDTSLDRALDSGDFANARLFYEDALNDNLQGYVLLFENDFGSAFLKQELFEIYFPSRIGFQGSYLLPVGCGYLCERSILYIIANVSAAFVW